MTCDSETYGHYYISGDGTWCYGKNERKKQHITLHDKSQLSSKKLNQKQRLFWKGKGGKMEMGRERTNGHKRSWEQGAERQTEEDGETT